MARRTRELKSRLLATDSEDAGLLEILETAMLRRLMVLFFVAGVSGTAGVCVGFLYAPALGADTRASLGIFLDQHDVTLSDLYTRGRERFAHAVDSMSGSAGPDAPPENED
jgi:hypothetical protein